VTVRTNSLTRLARGAAVVAVGLALLTACGGGSSGSASSTTSAASSSSSSAASSGSSTEAQAITATEKDFSISLDKDALTAGSYAIKVVNNGNSTHDLAVEKDGKTMATSDKIGPGESTTLNVDLAAGDYTFYCSIDGHRAMGMEISVKVS